MKNIKKFNEGLEDYIIDGERTGEYDKLTNVEKMWLKRWLESCDQQWGFEPVDHKNIKNIFVKLDIKL